MKQSKFGTFPNIADSRSPLVTTDARSTILANLTEAWPTLNDRKKQHVTDLVLNQFENNGVNQETREPLLIGNIPYSCIFRLIVGVPPWKEREVVTLQLRPAVCAHPQPVASHVPHEFPSTQE